MHYMFYDHIKDMFMLNQSLCLYVYIFLSQKQLSGLIQHSPVVIILVQTKS